MVEWRERALARQGGRTPRFTAASVGSSSLLLGRAGAGGWVVAVQDLAVRPWEDEPLVAVPEPDEVRRGAVVTPDLEDLSGVIRRPHLLAAEEKPLTDLSLHVHHLLGIRIRAPEPRHEGP